MFNKFKGSFQMFAFLCIWRFIVFFHQVFPKTSGVFAGEVAPITLERFLSGVFAHVHFQITSFTAIVDAFITRERFLSSVLHC